MIVLSKYFVIYIEVTDQEILLSGTPLHLLIRWLFPGGSLQELGQPGEATYSILLEYIRMSKPQASYRRFIFTRQGYQRI
jgi:hypothetical protein